MKLFFNTRNTKKNDNISRSNITVNHWRKLLFSDDEKCVRMSTITKKTIAGMKIMLIWLPLITESVRVINLKFLTNDWHQPFWIFSHTDWSKNLLLPCVCLVKNIIYVDNKPQYCIFYSTYSAEQNTTELGPKKMLV